MSPDIIAQALAALGNTPQEVYRNLKLRGIKGKLLSMCHCPVANYLTLTIGKPCIVSARWAGEYQNITGESSSLPQSVRQFIIDFDSDRNYQDLLET